MNILAVDRMERALNTLKSIQLLTEHPNFADTQAPKHIYHLCWSIEEDLEAIRDEMADKKKPVLTVCG